MKAVLSNRIYLDVLPHTKSKIDSELTYAIPSFKYGDPPQLIKNMGVIRNELVAIPRNSFSILYETVVRLKSLTLKFLG